MKTRTIENVLFVAVAAVMLVMLLKALPLGLGSSGMIRYWNNDDANILSNYGHLYRKVVIPPVDYIGYPYFFYYLSGVIVVPVALFLGATPEAVAIGWRLSNILFFLGTNALLFIIGRRYLNQKWTGLLAIFLYSTLQITLVFVLRFKPPTCETFLNLLIIIMCFRMLNAFQFKEWLALAVLAGCSFSTKYHALYLLPVIFGVLVVKLRHMSMEDERTRCIIRRGAWTAAVTAVLCGFLWAGALYLAEHRALYASTWVAFTSADRIFNTYIIDHIVRYSGVLFAAAILVAVIQTLIAVRGGASKTIGLANSYFFLFLGVFGLTVALTNPYVFVYPDETFDVFFRMYQIIFDGTGWDGSAAGGSRWEWFNIFRSSFVLGGVGAALFAWYVIFEIVLGGRRDWSATRPYRMVLLAHIVVYGGYLFTMVGLKKYHYLGPIIPDIALLSGFALSAAHQLLPGRVFRMMGGCLVVSLLAFNVVERWPSINFAIRYELNRKSDQGVIAAEWINAHYPKGTTMLSDLGTLGYITHVTLVSGAYQLGINGMRQFSKNASPHLIVVTRPDTSPLIEELSSSYQLVYSDAYTGTHDEISMIRILERRR